MIVDNIKNAYIYYELGEKYKTALEFLQQTNLVNLENGKYPIDGEDIYIIIQEYETKPEEEGKLEAHQLYTDIQYIIKGKEKLGYSDIKNFSPQTFYDSAKDIIFGSGNFDFVAANEGDFVIFTPQDAHMPCISIDKPLQVKKAVIKIKN
ncbi:MAG: YhcH/YjgK/YiaL family protein [bacterium]